jgi:AraC-like DNA-binding protein
MRAEEVLSVASVGGWLQLFDAIPDAYVFVKDRDSRFVHVNQALLRRLGMKSLDEIVGTFDSDRYPAEVAAALVAGDQAVMASGRGFEGKIEALLTEDGILGWYVTNKYPLKDDGGDVIGVVGIVRPYAAKRRLGEVDPQLDKVVAYVRERPGFPHRVVELAKVAGLSPRQLHRRFREAFGMSVQDFVNRSRVQTSSGDLLKTDATIGTIALKYGFCNHAGYTRMFQNFTGLTPKEFRRRHRQGQRG